VLSFIAKNGPAKTTHIIFGARLGYNQFTDLMIAMQEAGLVHKNATTWSITDKGAQFLAVANNPLLNVIGGHGD
jgi:predicted transcriptional regulator